MDSSVMESLVPKRDILVVLMAHGSRHDEGRRQAETMMDQIRDRCSLPTEKAYLEILEPDLEATICRHASESDKVFVLPLLIFKGGHALRDIPEMISRCRQEFPEMSLRQGPVLEPHGKVLDFWTEYGRSWLSQHSEGRVLLLGRGAKDCEAKEAFSRIQAQLEQDLSVPVLEAFTGIQEPDLPSVLEGIRREDPLLIFPCLLFDGVLLERSREFVKDWNATWAPTLAQSPNLVDQILQVIEEEVAGF